LSELFNGRTWELPGEVEDLWMNGTEILISLKYMTVICSPYYQRQLVQLHLHINFSVMWHIIIHGTGKGKGKIVPVR
jgi:hypothetical protein